MLIEGQKVEVKWNPNNKKHYESKGYTFTKCGDTFTVMAEHLPKTCKIIKVKVKCDYCGEIFTQKYCDYIYAINANEKSCCSNCKKIKIGEIKRSKEVDRQYEEFILLCDERGYYPISKKSDYVNANKKLKMSCKRHGIFEISLSNLRRGKGCRLCGNENNGLRLRNNIEKIRNEIESKNSNKLLNPEEYKNSHTKNLRVVCGSCGNEFLTSYGSIAKSSGKCKQCSSSEYGKKCRISKDELIRLVESNNNKILNPEDYIDVKTSNLIIVCGSCGKKYTTSLANYRNKKDGKCVDCMEVSIGETMIADKLDEYGISYQRQFRFEDCKDKNTLPFDFYLKEYNCCIEFDGAGHYEPCFGGCKEDRIENLLKTKRHDKIKDEYCESNDINLIRIPYWERHNIEDVLIKELHIKNHLEDIV